jgi:hypothetical protein
MPSHRQRRARPPSSRCRASANTSPVVSTNTTDTSVSCVPQTRQTPRLRLKCARRDSLHTLARQLGCIPALTPPKRREGVQGRRRRGSAAVPLAPRPHLQPYTAVPSRAPHTHIAARTSSQAVLIAYTTHHPDPATSHPIGILGRSHRTVRASVSSRLVHALTSRPSAAEYPHSVVGGETEQAPARAHARLVVRGAPLAARSQRQRQSAAWAHQLDNDSDLDADNSTTSTPTRRPPTHAHTPALPLPSQKKTKNKNRTNLIPNNPSPQNALRRADDGEVERLGDEPGDAEEPVYVYEGGYV